MDGVPFIASTPPLTKHERAKEREGFHKGQRKIKNKRESKKGLNSKVITSE